MLGIISLSKSEILSGSERDAVTSLCTSERFIVVGIDNGLVGIFDQKGIFGMRWIPGEHTVWSVDVWEEEWLICGGGEGHLMVWDLNSL